MNNTQVRNITPKTPVEFIDDGNLVADLTDTLKIDGQEVTVQEYLLDSFEGSGQGSIDYKFDILKRSIPLDQGLPMRQSPFLIDYVAKIRKGTKVFEKEFYASIRSKLSNLIKTKNDSEYSEKATNLMAQLPVQKEELDALRKNHQLLDSLSKRIGFQSLMSVDAYRINFFRDIPSLDIKDQNDSIFLSNEDKQAIASKISSKFTPQNLRVSIAIMKQSQIWVRAMATYAGLKNEEIEVSVRQVANNEFEKILSEAKKLASVGFFKTDWTGIDEALNVVGKLAGKTEGEITTIKHVEIREIQKKNFEGSLNRIRTYALYHKSYSDVYEQIKGLGLQVGLSETEIQTKIAEGHTEAIEYKLNVLKTYADRRQWNEFVECEILLDHLPHSNRSRDSVINEIRSIKSRIGTRDSLITLSWHW